MPAGPASRTSLEILEGAGFTAELTGCDGVTDTRCDVFGATAGIPLGAPSPINAGGISVCVTVDFASDLVGTLDLATGDLQESARVDIGVFLNSVIDAPCPSCVPDDGDPQLGKAGTCRGGPNDGHACAVGGLAGREYSVRRGTSNDWPPAGDPIAAFTQDATATTGTVT